MVYNTYKLIKGKFKMKKALKYIIILAVSAVLSLLYGFTVGGEISLWFAGLQIASAVAIMIYFNQKIQYEPVIIKIIRPIVAAVMAFAFSIFVYTAVSSSSMTRIDSYEAVVTDINFSGSQRDRGNAYIYFNTPDGEEEWVMVSANASLVYPDGPPSRGDRIIIGEYKGLFGDIYLEYIMETDNEKGS